MDRLLENSLKTLIAKKAVLTNRIHRLTLKETRVLLDDWEAHELMQLRSEYRTVQMKLMLKGEDT